MHDSDLACSGARKAVKILSTAHSPQRGKTCSPRVSKWSTLPQRIMDMTPRLSNILSLAVQSDMIWILYRTQGLQRHDVVRQAVAIRRAEAEAGVVKETCVHRLSRHISLKVLVSPSLSIPSLMAHFLSNPL
jgi:hypothetical protein